MNMHARAFEPSSSWPPDYSRVLSTRARRLVRMRTYPELRVGAREFYSNLDTPEAAIRFIEDWGITYDPRNATSKTLPVVMPFVLFERQRELIRALWHCVRNDQSMLIEKCRDMGATWVCVGFSVWMFLFVSGSAIGWGSRKEMLVDRIGDPDSIFEKIRMFMRYLPRALWPRGFSEDHMTSMKMINPENEATITGEGGDNIGRGGRKGIYFKDESAHYPHPETIEAALADNTRVQIDISSVNGPGNVYHRRRESGHEWIPGRVPPEGSTIVFVMDWTDHPGKTQEWYDARRQKAEDEGLLHVFEQEVNRNYFAKMEGVIIPALWVKSAIDADKKLGIAMDDGPWCAGMDVADDVGGDLNSLIKRKGVKIKYAEHWGGTDVGVSTRRVAEECRGMDVYYDCLNLGAGVKAEWNRLIVENQAPRNTRLIPWAASAEVQNKHDRVVPDDDDTPLNKDFFKNMKAQAWWSLRRRFEITHRAVTGEITEFDVSEMICIDGTLPRLQQLRKELSQPTKGQSGDMKMVVNKTPKGTRSPNLADGTVQCFYPVDSGHEQTDLNMPLQVAAGGGMNSL